ncbi:YesL family protein [Bifidobacterium choloepi]|uniref:DUF624 domain-containing protein n=1 Tax=Bifidobacterium choloepi TaxID=2614131 RepID=A0A6I5N1R1_9BIFI|nr:YesL family protein [Bifidobacterium choloepi]NEG70557.1 DUF624 domain-containing protein [Bifidobacterium choloepi]
MHFLSADSKFMTAWTNLTDAIWINILMLITSIPVVTIGASLAAGETAIRKMHNSEGHLTKAYFRAFRENFAKATGYWLILLVTGVALLYSWVVLQVTPLLIPKIAFTLLWAVCFEWVFALQARFENSFGRTLANSFIFGISYVWATLSMLFIDLVVVALVVAAWFLLPQSLFLVAVFGYGSILTLHVPIQEYIFRKHIHVPAAPAAEPVREKSLADIMAEKRAQA